jgi:hypothetical protein
MRNGIYLVVILSFFTLTSLTAKCQQWTDSISKKVDSIIQEKFRGDSANVYTTLYDTNMPEGWFSILRFDTLTGTIFQGNSYVYKGKFKYLTNYFFYNNKLIASATYKVPIKKQDSDKYDYWHRNCVYWNDTLIHSQTTNNDPFDYKEELKTAYEIVRRLKNLYTTKKFFLTPGIKEGRFR